MLTFSWYLRMNYKLSFFMQYLTKAIELGQGDFDIDKNNQ